MNGSLRMLHHSPWVIYVMSCLINSCEQHRRLASIESRTSHHDLTMTFSILVWNQNRMIERWQQNKEGEKENEPHNELNFTRLSLVSDLYQLFHESASFNCVCSDKLERGHLQGPTKGQACSIMIYRAWRVEVRFNFLTLKTRVKFMIMKQQGHGTWETSSFISEL